MPTVSPATAITDVRRRIGDVNVTQRLTDDQVDLAIQSAVERYSKDRPNEAVVKVTGNGTPFYALSSSLTGFVRDWSIVRRIEYPTVDVTGTATPTFLTPAKDWAIHRTEAGDYLRFLAATPAASESFRAWYTIPRVWTVSSVTVLSPDQNAVLCLAASFALDVLANMSADNLDTLIPTDAVDYSTIQERFRSQAAAWAKRYDAHMSAVSGGSKEGLGGGAGSSPAKAAAIRRNWDVGAREGYDWMRRRGRT